MEPVQTTSGCRFDTSVIVSTYNTPVSLEKTLWGYQAQTFRDFEIIVADDGSTDETADVVRRCQHFGMPVVHLWQADEGFRKNRILNKAILAARSPYCILTDGDCIPRSDFVASHARLRETNRFLAAGSHIALPADFHERINRDEIISGEVFRPQWLRQNGHRSFKNLFRLAVSPWLQPILNALTHRASVFTGNGSSAWRDDLLSVNGFDERLAYGGEDKDLGYRLMAKGVKSLMRKFSLISVHLDHPRVYVDEDTVAKNRRHLKQLRASDQYWTEHGIIEGKDPSGQIAG